MNSRLRRAIEVPHSLNEQLRFLLALILLASCLPVQERLRCLCVVRKKTTSETGDCLVVLSVGSLHLQLQKPNPIPTILHHQLNPPRKGSCSWPSSFDY
ncbi:hypothetical protein CEP53_010815 [Fusarium sp. AF-6]|nr:hypothetical protein CEP53_010815 [Fusarium sp. AF-6]